MSEVEEKFCKKFDNFDKNVPQGKNQLESTVDSLKILNMLKQKRLYNSFLLL